MDLISAERQLNDLVERRATEKNNANAQAMTWAASARRHREKQRMANRAAWYAHHCHMRELHQSLADQHEAKAHKLLEDHE